MTKEYAEKTISLYEDYDNRFRHQDGSQFVVLSDEWYLTVGKDVPESHHYNGLELEENGVGQVRSFKELWTNFKFPKIQSETRITIGSGTLISETFQNWYIPKLNTIPNLTVNYVPIRNEFLGKNEVTVTGLLTGGDIINQLKGKDLGEKVIFSERIVNETSGEMTLDDLTLKDISNAIGVPFHVSPDEPDEFFKVLAAD